MKIERISENQIRCTLSKDELIERQIQLSELAYGSDQAKLLFQEMMQEASEVGFEAEDIPLMIEAIPASSESLVLIVTKVEDPDELDTRFSRFTDSESEEYEDEGEFEPYDVYETDFKPVEQDTLSLINSSKKDEAAEKEQTQQDMVCQFVFPSLDAAGSFSRQVFEDYRGLSRLYKDERSRTFHLLLHKGMSSPEVFNRCCNVASEYGQYLKAKDGGAQYLEEHCRLMLGEDAIKNLARVYQA